MRPKFPWYDSQWLSSYVRAKEHLGREAHPSLARFESETEVFRVDPGFERVRTHDLIPESARRELAGLAEALPRERLERHEMLTFGRLVARDVAFVAQLQRALVERVSEAVGEPVEPSYHFVSLYNNFGVCGVHLDAPSAKWTVDYCIEQSNPWDLNLAAVRPWPEHMTVDDGWASRVRGDPANRFEAIALEPGEAVVFGGSSQWHYRDAIPRTSKKNFCHLLFLHYVPRGSRALLDPETWADRYAAPGLRDVVVPFRSLDVRSIVPRLDAAG